MKDFIDSHWHDLVALFVFICGILLIVLDFGGIGLSLVMAGLTALGMNSPRRPRNGNGLNNIT